MLIMAFLSRLINLSGIRVDLFERVTLRQFFNDMIRGNESDVAVIGKERGQVVIFISVPINCS